MTSQWHTHRTHCNSVSPFPHTEVKDWSMAELLTSEIFGLWKWKMYCALLFLQIAMRALLVVWTLKSFEGKIRLFFALFIIIIDINWIQSDRVMMCVLVRLFVYSLFNEFLFCIFIFSTYPNRFKYPTLLFTAFDCCAHVQVSHEHSENGVSFSQFDFISIY